MDYLRIQFLNFIKSHFTSYFFLRLVKYLHYFGFIGFIFYRDYLIKNLLDLFNAHFYHGKITRPAITVSPDGEYGSYGLVQHPRKAQCL